MRAESLSFLLLLSFANGAPCPDGYTLSSSGDDCYMMIDFYDSFSGNFLPKSFDDAESACNTKSGGLLASVHSWEDNHSAFGLRCRSSAPGTTKNLGLRCHGKACKWDDGTPVLYTYFREEPKDDGRTRCYAPDDSSPAGAWEEKNCSTQEHDCWICRVKARTIECVDGETEYKGGCVSVHTTPLDQKAAEESCPGGGHLVSIHSLGKYGENELYKRLALEAGVNGTIYIGGQFIKGVFEWIDGTYYGMSNWASSFPNAIFGNCIQMLLESEFGIQGQWTNIDCLVKQPYMCFRDGADYSKYITVEPPKPKADPQCPPIQYFTGNGTFYSPNYPLSIPANISCEYIVETPEGTLASVRFPTYDCNGGTALYFYDGKNDIRPFDQIICCGAPSPTVWRHSPSNVLKLIFNTTTPNIGMGWEIEHSGMWGCEPWC